MHPMKVDSNFECSMKNLAQQKGQNNEAQCTCNHPEKDLNACGWVVAKLNTCLEETG